MHFLQDFVFLLSYKMRKNFPLSLRNVLKKGGNAVDAMIATMFCDGVTMPQSMGIGGGFFMIIYNKKLNNFVAIDARETAPSGASTNMYRGNVNASQIGER